MLFLVVLASSFFKGLGPAVGQDVPVALLALEAVFRRIR
jgi:hypothetical protein